MPSLMSTEQLSVAQKSLYYTDLGHKVLILAYSLTCYLVHSINDVSGIVESSTAAINDLIQFRGIS